ncbi:MAG: gamma-glutamyl-gamma-aminobutyrate hydrolase family protein [Anaerolineaceae bacterium]
MTQTHQPLIAIPSSLAYHKTSSPTYETQQAYVQALLSAGGLPVLLPAALPLQSLEILVDTFDGFLFSGGGDVDPAHYGGEMNASVYGVNPERDSFELALIRLVLQADKPVLAICRGIQVLNVAQGGDLITDIASHLPQAFKHDWFPSYERDRLVHQVQVAGNSKLESILGARQCQTNSLHHQALNRTGTGLVVSALAQDGVIEGVEIPDRSFVVGVQWHPECLPEETSSRSLFRAFVQACQSDRPATR